METFASSLDALADWRRSLDRRIVELGGTLTAEDDADTPTQTHPSIIAWNLVNVSIAVWLLRRRPSRGALVPA